MMKVAFLRSFPLKKKKKEKEDEKTGVCVTEPRGMGRWASSCGAGGGGEQGPLTLGFDGEGSRLGRASIYRVPR